MTLQKILFKLAVILALATASTLTLAGDFDWLKEFNIKAVNDGDHYRTQLATRFQIGRAQIDAIVNDVANPADAYMILRLGELSRRPTDDVIKTYKTNKNKGWGNIAKSLGIKPGSKRFHALKRGNDMDEDGKKRTKKTKSKSGDKEHGKDKNKGEDKDKDKE